MCVRVQVSPMLYYTHSLLARAAKNLNTLSPSPTRLPPCCVGLIRVSMPHTCSHTYTDTHMQTHTHTHTHTYMQTHMQTHTRAHAHACKHTHTHTHANTHTHAHTHAHTHILSVSLPCLPGLQYPGQSTHTDDPSAPPHLTPISSTFTPTQASSTSNGASSKESAVPAHPPIRNSEPQSSEAWRARGNELFKVLVWVVWV